MADTRTLLQKEFPYPPRGLRDMAQVEEYLTRLYVALREMFIGTGELLSTSSIRGVDHQITSTAYPGYIELGAHADFWIYSTTEQPYIRIINQSDTARDPVIQWSVGATPSVKYTMGVDDSDSDAFVLGFEDSLGTANLIRFETVNENCSFGYDAQMHLTLAEHSHAFGDGAQHALTEGSQNDAFGHNAQWSLTTGGANSAFGYTSQLYLVDGDHNSSFGDASLWANVSGDDNCAFGMYSLRNATGSDNTAVGYYSGYTATNVSGCVFLGNEAGYYETASNKLFIDNTLRASEADARTKALIYGIFAAATANQYLYLNANVSTPQQFTSTLAIGTSPFAVTSTTVNTNLNADLWDGYQFSDYLNQAVRTTDGPTFDHLHLTTDLPVSEGGTGVSTLSDGGLMIGNGTGAVEVVTAGTTTQILVGGGANTAPVWGTDIPTAVTIGTQYIYRVGGTDIAVADGGTGLSSYAVGDILYASAATTIAGLADVAVGSYLRSGGAATAPLWSTLILPNAATAYRLPVATGANTIGELAAAGATGEYLAGATGAIPAWATLNQAAVAGLTTTSGPTFDHLHITNDVAAASFTIGANALTTAEWAYLDGQNQAVKTTDDVTFDLITTSADRIDQTDASGLHNIGVGYTALDSNTTGTLNTALGYQALTANTNKSYSTAVGSYALSQSTAESNTAVGSYAAWQITTGANNTALGQGALPSGTDCTQNTAIGAGSLYKATGSYNCSFGGSAGYSITTGVQNVAVGYNAMSGGSATGSYNMAIGSGSMGDAITSAGYNAAVGCLALAKVTSGSSNMAIGYYSLHDLTTGSSNVAIGQAAGQSTNGSGNVFLGFDAGIFETGSNKLFIDNAQRASEADGRVKALVYGGFAATTAAQWLTANANFGIGTSTFGTSADFVLSIATGTAPSSSIADSFQLYSADLFGLAGATYPHFRTEDGKVRTFGSRDIVNPAAGTPQTITAAMCSGSIITNANAAADVEYDIPAAQVGMEITFYVTTAHKMKIDPNGTDQIMVLTGAAGDFLESDAVIGSFMTLVCLVANKWHKINHAGTWTEE